MFSHSEPVPRSLFVGGNAGPVARATICFSARASRFPAVAPQPPLLSCEGHDSLTANLPGPRDTLSREHAAFSSYDHVPSVPLFSLTAIICIQFPDFVVAPCLIPPRDVHVSGPTATSTA